MSFMRIGLTYKKQLMNIITCYRLPVTTSVYYVGETCYGSIDVGARCGQGQLPRLQPQRRVQLCPQQLRLSYMLVCAGPIMHRART